MVLIKSYARTGSRSWNIGGEKVQLKPFRRGSMQPEPKKPPETDTTRRPSLPDVPPKRYDPQNSKADYTVKLVPDSPPIIEAGPPKPPKPTKKKYTGDVNKRRTQTIEVSFTFVIGGYNTRID